MRLEDYDTGTTYSARVIANRRLTSGDAAEDVRDIVIAVPGADTDYRPGQSIGVIVDGDQSLGQKHHFRLYSVADVPPRGDDGAPRISLCVKRCSYIDEYSGEEYSGIASNFLCDRAPGDTLTVNGPFGLPFAVPDDREADLLLIGMGTGIAPFRMLLRHIYEDIADWRGRVRLFYGARSGLEMLYMNDEMDDFSQYYDRDTFEAIRALSPRPHWSDPIAIDDALASRGEEIVTMLDSPHTHIYVAGREDILDTLDRVFADIIGDPEKWQRRKAELKAGRRWAELVY